MNAVANNNNTPMMISLVNTINTSLLENPVKFGVTIANPNHAAERFPVTEDNAFKNALFVFVMSLM